MCYVCFRCGLKFKELYKSMHQCSTNAVSQCVPNTYIYISLVLHIKYYIMYFVEHITICS